VKAGEHLAAIDSFLNSTVGTAGVDLEPLRKLLKNIETTLAAYLPAAAEAGVDGATEPGAVAGGGSSAGPRLSGTVQSRDDVVKALDRICDYYRQQEPSSPVPYILKRAQRMVKMNFMEIVNELTPDAMTQVRVITGPDETTTT